MSENFCVFGTDRCKCIFPKENWPFFQFICQGHLNEVYGLDTWYLRSEGEVESYITGPFLIPTVDTYFHAKTVVFPTRAFIDKMYFPDPAAAQADDYVHKLNPALRKFLAGVMSGPRTDQAIYSGRYQYEVVRNLGHPPDSFNLGHHNEQDQFIRFKNVLQSTLHRVSTTIGNIPIYHNQFSKITVNPNQVPLNNEGLLLSNPYKVLLSHSIFSFHSPPLNNVATFLSNVPFNLQYEANVGFVTTEPVSHPFPLVLNGRENGSMMWYMNKVNVIDKTVKAKPAGVKNVQGFSQTQASLRGASKPCLF